MRARRIAGHCVVALSLLLGSGAGCDARELGDPITIQATDDLPNGVETGRLSDWVETCGDGSYPCPPYGFEVGDVLENTLLFPGNSEAQVWGQQSPDGLFSLRTYYQSEAVGLFVFFGSHW